MHFCTTFFLSVFRQLSHRKGGETEIHPLNAGGMHCHSLGPFTSRAYRLIEFPFPYMSYPTTTNVVCSFSWPPLTRGLAFAKQKTGGENISSSRFSPSVFACGESTSLIRGRRTAAAGLGIANAFENHRPVVFFVQK